MILQFRRFSIVLIGSVLLFLLIALPRAGTAATTWTVNAKMTLTQLQAVIDGAPDGDTILFEKGSYDFSGAPFHAAGDYIGALNIVGKSLVLLAKKGVIIKGTPSVLNTKGYGASGITAFVFKNEERKKDVIVRGFNFNTLLMGISVYGCRNVVVQNCVLNEIDGTGIGTSGLSGDLSLMNNQIASRQRGFLVDWYYFGTWGTYFQTPGTRLQIANNVTIQLGNFLGFDGVFLFNFREGQIVGNSVVANGRSGIYIYSDGKVLPSCFVSGNTIQGADSGIRVVSASGAQIINNAVSDVDWGIYLQESTNCNVTANRLSDVAITGVVLAGPTCAQNRVTYNFIRVAGPLEWTESINSYGILTQGHHNQFLRNTVSGTGSAAFFIYSDSYSTGHDEVFECNNARSFVPAPNAAHYVFFNNTYNNRFSETWAGGVFYLDFGANNTVTTRYCW